MMLLRWEIVPLLHPWAAPQSNALGAPIASGTIVRNDWDPSAGANMDPAVFAPSDPIAIPAAADGASFHMLALEVVGLHPWFVTLANPYQPTKPIQASAGVLQSKDEAPSVLVPGGGVPGGRSREIRVVIPGSTFIVRPIKL